MGPAIATQILLDSSLGTSYRLFHINTNVHQDLKSIGSWSLKKTLKNFRIYIRFFRMLVQTRPDLVLIPISQATPGFIKDSVFIWLSRLFRRTTLLQLRGSNFQNWLQASPMLLRKFVEHTVGKAQGMVVLGHNLRYLFEPYFSPEQIFVVPNGANYTFPDVPEPRVPASTSVLYLGNLQPTKGIADVIDAVALLKSKGLEGFTLDVVGSWRDPKTEAYCLNLVKQANLPVTFHGPAYGPDKLGHIKQADIFVFPPRAPEGHPWVIVEAMAAGLPIISTDQGAIRESVRDGENGYIVPAQDPSAIANRLDILISDPEQRLRMGHASRTHYERHFTEDAMVTQMKAAIDTLLHV